MTEEELDVLHTRKNGEAYKAYESKKEKDERAQTYIDKSLDDPQPKEILVIPPNFVPVESDTESLTPVEDAISPRLGNSYDLKEPSNTTILGTQYPDSGAETEVENSDKEANYLKSRDASGEELKQSDARPDKGSTSIDILKRHKQSSPEVDSTSKEFQAQLLQKREESLHERPTSLAIPEDEVAPDKLERTSLIDRDPWGILLSGGGGQVNGNQLSIGMVSDNGQARPLAMNDDRVTVAVVNTSVFYDVGHKGPFSNVQLVFDGGFQWGTTKDSGQEGVGGRDVGYAYDQPNADGFTGINLGMGGAKATAKNRVRFGRISFGARGDIGLGNGLTLTPQTSLSFQQSNQRSNGALSSLTFGDAISSETTLDLAEQRYGIGIKGRLTKAFQEAGVSVFAGGGIDGLYRVTHTEITQENVCLAFGCTAAANFDGESNAEDSGPTYSAKGIFGVSYAFLSNSVLTLAGRVEYLGEQGEVVNKGSSNNVRKEIEANDAFNWNVVLGIVHRFGGFE